MPEGRDTRERDLVLAPNEYAFILDETKGNVIAYVGPHKTSLANTDRPVIFEEISRRFKNAHLDEAIKPFPFANEGWYIVLENPAKGAGDDEHPHSGPNNLPKLTSGRKINLPGPVTFPLWPGQVARVIVGHQLHSNEYLLVKVYNEEAARENWKKAVIKPQKNVVVDMAKTEQPGEPAAQNTVKPDEEIPDLTTGKLMVVKGTNVSFYIPPTGIEVLSDESENYVRKAVTLERLEYCILLDENGNKRFIEGPAVVFPEPTESFVEKDGSRKFMAIELNENSGIYIKVIAPYKDLDGTEHKVGEELFITGKDQMIYFPRPEHVIVKYSKEEVHHAVAIPTGESRYVLNKMTGEISLKKGPCMFLPDPRKEMIIRRVLTPNVVQLWFPGNQEALEYNAKLMQMASISENAYFVTDLDLIKGTEEPARTENKKEDYSKKSEKKADANVTCDNFQREPNQGLAKSITASSKYEGAVMITVWTGYAVLVVSKVGTRKVIVGPKSYAMEYNEVLEYMELSTGTPKSDQNLVKTVYLRVLNNKVSDMISAETKDLCQVRLYLSYRVNFEGDPEKWFNVENYVKFLTDHMRSLVRNAVKQRGIEEFYANAISIIRDTILGTPTEEGKRPGRLFQENGMRIYDVEILDVQIGDEAIAELLREAQHNVVQQAIEISKEEKKLEIITKAEEIKQKIAEAQAATTQKSLALQTQEIQKKQELNLTQVQVEANIEKAKLDTKMEQQDKLNQIQQAELAREKSRQEQNLAIEQRKQEQKIEELKAQVQAVVDKSKAISPEFIAALQAFADKDLAEKVAHAMSPLAILGGKSVADVFSQLLKGTVLENVMKK